MKSKIVILTGLILFSLSSFAQQMAYSDPAVAFNKLLLDKGQTGALERVGNYKVQGSPFLFAGEMDGEVYKDGQVVSTGKIKYNTYNQVLSFTPNGQTLSMDFDNKAIDSFIVHSTASNEVSGDMNFVSGRFYDSNSKLFVQKLKKGNQYQLLKEYQSVLGVVSTNYIDSELREYDLNVDYAYATNPASKSISKIKLNKRWLKGQFTAYPQALAYAETATLDRPDIFLVSFFSYL